jgi:hypothetical protein
VSVNGNRVQGHALSAMCCFRGGRMHNVVCKIVPYSKRRRLDQVVSLVQSGKA